MERAKRDEIVFDQPANSQFYDELRALLEKLTGRRWGLNKAQKRVRYLASDILGPNGQPLRVGALWDKGYEKSPNYRLDVEIFHRDVTAFRSKAKWREIVSAEICVSMYPLVSADVRAELAKWRPTDEDAAALMFAGELPRPAGAVVPFDKWADTA